MDLAWTRTNDEVFKYFNVDEERGYSDEQAKKALEKYGPNGMFSNMQLNKTSLSVLLEMIFVNGNI